MAEAAHTTVDPGEIERFSRIASEWWDPTGKFAPLHRLNPIRIGYIRDRAASHWQRDALGNGVFSNIGSATSSTYTLVNADDGCSIRCQVTDTDTGAGVAFSNVVGAVIQPLPVNTVLPAVTGATTQGSVLTTTNGTWSNMAGVATSFSYQWLRDTQGVSPYSAIPGATSTTYTLQAADDACHVLCVVTAHNTGSP